MSDQCVFCEIIRGQSPVSWTYQDDTVVAFMDVQPITHGHMLVLPREHAILMTDINEPAAMRTYWIARQLADVARHAIAASDRNLPAIAGDPAEQYAPHFHVHVIPRYPHARVRLTF